MESSEARAERIASDYLLTGDHDFTRKYIDRIAAVTAKDVHAAAEKYLRADRSSTVLIAPANRAAPRQRRVEDLKGGGVVRSVLPNGVRLLVRHNDNIPAVAVTCAMLGGVESETGPDNGISAVTARMMLKGTGSRRESQISGAIEALGGRISPFSGFNSFGIEAEVPEDGLRQVLEIVKDAVADPSFPQAELDREKERQIAIIKQEDDDIYARGANELMKMMFAGTPYALRLSGERGPVASLCAADLKRYHSARAVSENVVVSVSGAADPAEVFAAAGKAFSGIRKGSFERKKPVAAAISADEKTISMQRDESLVLEGFVTAGVDDPDRYALDVLASVLSGQSGRLFSGIRADRSLAYALGCVSRPLLDAGYFEAYVATTKAHINEARDALSSELDAVLGKAVSQDEVESARKELISRHRASMQSNAYVATTAALDELYGVGYNELYNYEAKISAVTADDISRVAGKYLSPGRCAKVVISPES
jgi:zinc protease